MTREQTINDIRCRYVPGSQSGTFVQSVRLKRGHLVVSTFPATMTRFAHQGGSITALFRIKKLKPS